MVKITSNIERLNLFIQRLFIFSEFNHFNNNISDKVLASLLFQNSIPDDYFQLSQALSYQYYKLNNYYTGLFTFGDGESHNLSYNIWKTEDKFNAVIQILTHYKSSSIIYCNTRQQSEQLAQKMIRHGLAADFFHGGLLLKDKKTKLSEWQKGILLHMSATSAFGMGIDKSNVRTVIHMNLPESIEHYYQETGRAGRDGDLAHTFLLFNDSDSEETKHHFLSQLPSTKDLKEIYKDLCNFLQIAYGEGKDITYELNFESFCSQYNRNFRKTLYCLNQFDREGIISLKASEEKYIDIKTNEYKKYKM